MKEKTVNILVFALCATKQIFFFTLHCFNDLILELPHYLLHMHSEPGKRLPTSLFHFKFSVDNIVLDFKRCMSEEK